MLTADAQYKLLRAVVAALVAISVFILGAVLFGSESSEFANGVFLGWLTMFVFILVSGAKV